MSIDTDLEETYDDTERVSLWDRVGRPVAPFAWALTLVGAAVLGAGCFLSWGYTS